MSARDSDYDEIGLIQTAAVEMRIPESKRLPVRRYSVETPGGDRQVSALVWGDEEPELVLLHGGGQNAHTWDTVALLLARPLVAIDLPSHGHSDPRSNNPLDPVANGVDIAPAVEMLAPTARAVVGMSLGGLTAIALGHREPQLVRKLGLVDVTPGGEHGRGSPIVAMLTGPESFESFEAMLAEAAAFSPNRSITSLRRGVQHNAVQRADGRWEWRHFRGGVRASLRQNGLPDPSRLWPELAATSAPVILVRGDGPGSVVIDADVEEVRRYLPSARVEMVQGAGHNVQSDQPQALAGILSSFIDH
jgi:pimeloyl-ACP methyl ester carboxylesterase